MISNNKYVEYNKKREKHLENSAKLFYDKYKSVGEVDGNIYKEFYYNKNFFDEVYPTFVEKRIFSGVKGWQLRESLIEIIDYLIATDDEYKHIKETLQYDPQFLHLIENIKLEDIINLDVEQEEAIEDDGL
ncbi:MAG: hypothetical protein ACW981_15305 [Candidatus Hodarchaeales archaeon]|jgi:hypothetical protein